MQEDKYMNPNSKARWGFGGDAGNITVGPKTVGETGGVEHGRSDPKDQGATNNGGGDAQPQARSRKRTTEE